MTNKKARQKLQSKSPQGHMLAHITPEEGKILQFFGGSGKIHKPTGVRSYAFEEDETNIKNTVTNVFGNEVTPMDTSHQAYLSGTGAYGMGGSSTASTGGGSGGGGGGGGGIIPPPVESSTRTSTATSQTELDPKVKEARDKSLDMAMEAASGEFQEYKGTGIAGRNADQANAAKAVRKAQGQGQTSFNAAQTTAQGVQGYNPNAVGQQNAAGVSNRMNPYVNNVVAANTRQAMDAMRMGNNAISADANMQGAGMGSRAAIQKGAMQAQVLNNLNQQNAGLMQQGYRDAVKQELAYDNLNQNTDVANQNAFLRGQQLNLEGAKTGANIANMGNASNRADISMLAASGAEQQIHDQNVADYDRSEWDREQNHPYKQAQFLSGITTQSPSGQHTTQNTPQYKTKNRWGNAMSGAAAGYTVGGPWGAAAGGLMGYMS